MLRLDRLEIHGFKSFGDRTELRFRPGVTAVVGPNGCGKSNIGDAINWVLGEQSARMLRGQQMADVIGIIAAGKLVKEGSMEALLQGEDAIKVRVAADQVATARELLGRLPNPGAVEVSDEIPGWLTVRIGAERAGEINQVLAEGGIYASRLEAGSQLEELFLSLTADESASHEGTFQGIR